VATLAIENDRLVVRLSLLERIGGTALEVPSAPLAAVRDVRTTTDPWRELRGIRAPGTGFPGVIALGHRRARGVHNFAAVYGRRPGVAVDLEGSRWTRFVVSADDPDAVVAELERGGLRRLPASS
jgi:hypothetical protein